MKPRFPIAPFVAALALALLAGCGEQPQVARYEQGKYEGKADTRPWDGAAFNGDRTAWELALRNRIVGQNEYKRVE